MSVMQPTESISTPMTVSRSRSDDSRINVLMYHSISNEPGPTSIPAEVFRGQMEILRDCEYNSVSVSDLASWHAGELELPPRSFVVTFDDGFADFADHAFPELQANNFSATIYIPAAKMGAQEDWAGANAIRRNLLTWRQVADFAKEGIDFGSHSLTHCDLTTLETTELRQELSQSLSEIEQRLQTTPISFAPPYGRSNQRVREEINNWYRVSVGTRLQHADRNCDLLDVPRIEMHYFRDLRRWRAYLEGRANSYLLARRIGRGVKSLASMNWKY